MPDQDFAETATETELREFASKLFKQVKKVRKAETAFDAKSTAEKEAKEKVKRLAGEKNTMIEEMDEEPDVEEMKAIKNKRFEELRAELDASDKNSKKNEAKHALAKETKALLEMIDESNDPQSRMDFDGASVPDEKDPKSPASTTKNQDVVIEWRDIAAIELDIPKAMATKLSDIGVTTMGDVQSLVFGNYAEYSSPSDVPGWGPGAVQKLLKAIDQFTEERTIEDFGLGDEEEDAIPTSLEEQLVSSVEDGEYEDAEGYDDADMVEVRVTSVEPGNGAEIAEGDIVAGVKIGGVVKVANSHGSVSLLPDQYELAEATA
ncbi:MAG: hypothetical protein AAGJ40_09775 [Planctomycetota bacterium]